MLDGKVESDFNVKTNLVTQFLQQQQQKRRT